VHHRAAAQALGLLSARDSAPAHEADLTAAARGANRAPDVVEQARHGVAGELLGLNRGDRDQAVKGADAFARVRPVNAYHFCGIAFAAWAVIVSFLGITREDFPSSASAARAVGTISVVLALATVGTAVYTAATEEHGGAEGAEEHALIR
jgi:hypothetical protein